jgi:hypothetical protein
MHGKIDVISTSFLPKQCLVTNKTFFSSGKTNNKGWTEINNFDSLEKNEGNITGSK